MSVPDRPCAQCGTPVPPDAPEGLCPQCLLRRVAEPTDPGLPEPLPAFPQPPPPPSLDSVAAAFPHLEILSLIGQGGMGVVFKARQKSLDRLVALKLLAPHRAHDASFAERFALEARALAALNHPHIVTIHDFGQASGFYFLLMEFVDGVNLRHLLKTRRLTPEEALAIVPPLCDALQFAHDRGIVHRDIKPENLLLDQTGRVKIADFGIARMLGAEITGLSNSPGETQAAGTPGYMAPEQVSSPRTADNRADIYSLGVVIYEMLTGELPTERLQAPSKKVQIDVRLDAIVLRALEQTPERRYQTADELRTQLETVTHPQTAAGITSPHAIDPPPSIPQAAPGILPKPSGNSPAPPPAQYSTQPKHPRRFPVLPVSVVLGHSVLLATLVFWSSADAFTLGQRLLAVAAVFLGSTGVLFSLRAWSNGHSFLSPTPRRLAAGFLVGLLAMAMGAYQVAKVRAGHHQRIAQLEEALSNSHNHLASLSSQALTARAALNQFETQYLESRTNAASEPLATTYQELTHAVAKATDQAEAFRTSVQEKETHLARLRSTNPSGLFRAWCPALPLFLTACMIPFRRRRSNGDQTSDRRKDGFGGDAVMVLLALGASLGLGGFLESLFEKDRDAFDAPFLPPSQPSVSQLGWSPVAVSNQVVFVDVTARIDRWSAEARWSFTGPHLPDSIEASLTDAFEPRIPGLTLIPNPHSGNTRWSILQAGTTTNRLAYVFPDAGLANLAFHSLSNRPVRSVDPGEDLGATLFHVFQPNGREYRATFRITSVVHAQHPDWVTHSRMGSWNEGQLDFTWWVSASRPGTATLTWADIRSTTQSGPRGKNGLVGVPIRLVLTPLGPDRVRIVHTVGGAISTSEKAGRYRDFVAEILRTATSGTKCLRGMPTELCRIEGVPLVVRFEDTSLSNPPQPGLPSPVTPVNGFSIPLIAFVGIGVLSVMAFGALLLVRRLRRPGGGGGFTLIVLILGGVLIFLVLVAVVVAALSLA